MAVSTMSGDVNIVMHVAVSPQRVSRVGAWNFTPWLCRSVNRDWLTSD